MTNEQQELLIARVAEGTAGPGDWDVLFATGRTDESLWRRLAESQRDQAQLEDLMTNAGAVADRVHQLLVAAIGDVPEEAAQ